MIKVSCFFVAPNELISFLLLLELCYYYYKAKGAKPKGEKAYQVNVNRFGQGRARGVDAFFSKLTPIYFFTTRKLVAYILTPN